ncbi:hypothetical protein AALP_AA6G092200 [Arabis alpina]|uniref:Uncharacterized protein n=2 Tax=Arabis alpina TaxID=50452 RepID=A0A087GN29_ARAAL|nr:hypothetical protein AALP_AA6G092200 [Arabis alpina]
MGMAWGPMSAAWTPIRPGTSVSLGSDIGAPACRRCHCSVTSVPGSFGLYNAFCWLGDLSDAAFMTSHEVKIASKVPLPGGLLFVVMETKELGSIDGIESVGLGEDVISLLEPTRSRSPSPTTSQRLDPDDSRLLGGVSSVFREVPRLLSGYDGSSVSSDIDPSTRSSGGTDVSLTSWNTDVPMTAIGPRASTSRSLGALTARDPDVMGCSYEALRSSPLDETEGIGADGRAEASFSSSSFDLRASNDEDTFDEVQQIKKATKAKKKVTVKVRPDPPGSSLSDMKSLQRLRRKCGISEEIMLIAPSPADRADALPPGYMTLFENYFDQCLLWFPLPRFLMRFLAVHGVCLAQINPRGIRHLRGIYVLSRECGVIINTEHFSYLTDFRVRGRSEELKHSVTNSSGMALIAGFPRKNDHFEDRFFFAEISERTVEADCTDLVKTRWERRVKPSLPEVSKDFVTAMHKELSSGNGNWRKSFSRKRIERALSAEIFPGKSLGRGQARMSFCKKATLEVAAKAGRSSGSSAPRVVAPMTSTPMALSVRARPSRPSASKHLLPPPSLGEVAEFRRLSAERAHISSGEVVEFRRLSAERTRISSGKRKDVDRASPSKRQRVDSHPATAVGRETSASRVGGLLREKASKLFLFFDRLSTMGETVERKEALERDVLALQKVKKDYEDKLSKLKSRCTKAEGEVVQLRGELSSASDLQRSRIEDAVAEVRDEIACGFTEQTSEVAGLLAEIGGKVPNDMLNLTEIDANLEFIGLLQGSDPPYLPTEVKALRERRHPIYDAHDVFADLLVSARRVLEIPVVPAGAAEASVVVDDDVEVSDEDNVEVTDDDEDAED